MIGHGTVVAVSENEQVVFWINGAEDVALFMLVASIRIVPFFNFMSAFGVAAYFETLPFASAP